MSRIISAICAVFVVALAVGCSSGASTTSLTGSTPIMATGTITGFGSIYVNGVHFQTGNASIRKNGVLVDQARLSVGEIARVQGTRSADGTGIAESIDVDENVVGPITALDVANDMLTVLGQSVKINTGTSFSMDIQPADITGLSVGEAVRISGMTDSSGNIVATRIELSSANEPYQVVGTVAGVDTMAHTFTISALLVDYSSANVTGFTSGMPANGDRVEVQGTVFDSSTSTMTATHVARMESDAEASGDHEDMEREGLITRFVSATDFDVAGDPVTTTSATVYRNGTAADLALNVKVEVEGTFDTNNVLVASVVSFHHNGNVTLEAQVTAIDAMAGTLTLLGVQVTVTSNTRYEDDSPAEVEMFNLSNITVGDTVIVHGYESPAGSGMLVATRLERKPSSTMVRVEGPYTAGTSPDFSVLGIMIDASGAILKSSDESILSLSDFLAQADGQNVDVTGTLTGNVVMATEARIDHHGEEGGDD